jgi:hypothetical protein
MKLRRIRIIAVERVESTTVDREVADLPRVGDGIGVNGRDVVVRSVVVAAPGNGFEALVYATMPLSNYAG